MSQNEHAYAQTFFTVPYRILQLPGLTLQLLRFYEVIFQFWHHGKDCFLNNKTLMQRTGMLSLSTIQDAFVFFEKLGEMKREMVGQRRYITQPQKRIEMGEHDPLAVARPPTRCSETPPLAVARHNKNNLNKNNISKDKDIVHFANALERFNEFWDVYPRKLNKKKAQAIWVRMKLDERADLLINDIVKRLEQDQTWQDKQFIPHPTTYLNGFRWEDEITPINKGVNANDTHRQASKSSIRADQRKQADRDYIESCKRRMQPQQNGLSSLGG